MKITILSILALGALVSALPAIELNAVESTEDVHVRDITKLADAVDGIADALDARAVCSTRAVTDRLMFSDSMATFSSARSRKSPACYDWTSNECSNSPDNPGGFKFKPSCRRHDFGYQNFRREGRCNATNKKKIDDQFKKDLYKECSQYSGLSSYKGVACRRVADLYYKAVREFGDC